MRVVGRPLPRALVIKSKGTYYGIKSVHYFPPRIDKKLLDYIVERVFYYNKKDKIYVFFTNRGIILANSVDKAFELADTVGAIEAYGLYLAKVLRFDKETRTYYVLWQSVKGWRLKWLGIL